MQGPERRMPWPGTAVIRIALGAVAALPLTACTNLSAITNYANSAGGVVGAKEADARWRDSEKQLLSLRLESDRPDCQIGRPGRPPQSAYDEAYAQMSALHDRLREYFAAIAALSGDEVPSKSAAAGADSLDRLADAGVPVGPDEQAALRSMTAVNGRLLDGARRIRLRELMEASHDDVARLLELLERLARVDISEVRGERVQADLYVACASRSADPAVRFLAARERRRVDERYEAELAAMDTYAAALHKVRLDHEAILQSLSLQPSQLGGRLKDIGDSVQDLDKARRAVESLAK